MLKIVLFSILGILLFSTTSIYAEDRLAIVHTESGDITIEFFGDDAPKHVENFITLAESNFYDNTVFHRVIKGFMIQGGDPNTKLGESSISQWGSGSPGHTVVSEFNNIMHNRGIVSMARSTDPNSAGSQFFVVHQVSNFLDAQYTVFGRIVTQQSFDTLDKIANLPVGERDVPVDWQATTITSIELVERSSVLDILDLDDPQRLSTPVTPIKPTPYVNEELGVSVMFPQGWVVQELNKTSAEIPDLVAIGPPTGGANPSISLSITPVDNRSLDDFIAEIKTTLQSAIDSGELEIIDESTMQYGQKSGYLIGAKGVFETQGTTVSVQFREVIFLLSEKFYTLTYTNSDENFDQHSESFNNVAESLTVLSDTMSEKPDDKDDTSMKDDQKDKEMTNEEGGGCLIATATYGSELSTQVQQLRELRDNTLLETESGSAFMSGFNEFYYSFSPTIADWERENPIFKETVKIALTPLITSLTLLNYVDINSEGEMISLGIGIILANIAMYFVAPAIILCRIRK